MSGAGRGTWRRVARLAALVLVAAGACGAARAQTQAPLPALGADIRQTSVSGLSSGAYMAGQFQVAHSEIVVGAGIVAGGPYACAESAAARIAPIWSTAVGYNLAQAVKGCMKNEMKAWGVPNAKTSADRAAKFARDGRIDPLSNLEADRVYLYSGGSDGVIVQPVMEAAREFYRLVGVPDDQVVFLKGGKAGHALVTETEGSACGVTEPPYLTDCDYDQAGAILKHIYGPLDPPAARIDGEFLEFDQTPFIEGNTPPGLAKAGVVFIPKSCRDGPGCRIHVAFHGCGQGREFVEDAHVKGSGFARWADANRIILLFPQIRSEAFNPQGCWDWWGYTRLDFMTKDAPQIAAIRRMLDRLAAAR